ncbi:MAG: hypothetical protein NZ518_10595, partial [Dehalococcoidia bacterium]|nr:hypothetical protein [Dehalococcoidia bacterium]
MRIVGAALLVVVLSGMLLAASYTPPTSGAALTIAQARHPVIGVHTRLTDEVEQWKIEKTMAMAREMGASWVVEYFPWTYMEPAKGRYD